MNDDRDVHCPTTATAARGWRWIWLSCGLAASLACGQESPGEPPDTSQQPYFPLVPGSWWEYEHSDWTERVTVESAQFNGSAAFLMSDSPNPKDSLRSDSIITSVDGRAARVTKDEYLIGSDDSELLTSSVTYGTGFTRFNEDWANQAVGYKETPAYVRVETPPGAEPKAPEARRHTFEVLALADPLNTPRGTFTCIIIQRTKDWQAEEEGLDPEEAETKQYWFARGVGKVQERNVETGHTEILSDFSIPTE